MTKKLEYEYIRDYINKTDEKLISKEYKNNRTKLEIKCQKCKNNYWKAFDHFKGRKQRCPNCSNKNKGLRRRGKNHPLWKGGVVKKDITLYNTYANQLKWCEEVRRDPENPDYLQVKCTNCDDWFNPNRSAVSCRLQVINGNGRGSEELNFYCSEKCKEACPMFGKIKYLKGQEPYYVRDIQKEWAELVKKRDGYECIRCGSKKDLIAHHIEGIWENMVESSDIDLGIAVCKKCHKKIHKEIGCRYVDLQRKTICEKERAYEG